MSCQHPMPRRAFVRFALAAPCAGLAAPAALLSSAVQASPSAVRGLQLVVPTAPGSQPDLIARWLAEPLAARAEGPVTVLNVPGAAGALAVDAVLQAPVERGSLLLGGLDHVAYSHLNSNRRPLDPFVDFTPVAAVNRDTWALVVAADAPMRSVTDLIVRARGEPLSFASTGEGSTAHLLSVRLCRAIGIEAEHVPYRDPWVPDLIGGRIHFAVAPTPAVLAPLRGGRVRVLASLTDEPLPLPGQPPTIRELGWADQVFYGGLFLFAPAALAALAPRVNAWLREVLVLPQVVQRYRDAFIEPTPVNLAEASRMVRERLQRVDAMRRDVFGRSR